MYILSDTIVIQIRIRYILIQDVSKLSKVVTKASATRTRGPLRRVRVRVRVGLGLGFCNEQS